MSFKINLNSQNSNRTNIIQEDQNVSRLADNIRAENPNLDFRNRSEPGSEVATRSNAQPSGWREAVSEEYGGSNFSSNSSIRTSSRGRYEEIRDEESFEITEIQDAIGNNNINNLNRQGLINYLESNNLLSNDEEDNTVENVDQENYYSNFEFNTEIKDISLELKNLIKKVHLENSKKIKMPRIISHDVLKISNNYINGNNLGSIIKGSNDNNFKDNDVYNVEKDFLQSIQELNADRFFINCDLENLYKNYHYDNLKLSFERLKNKKKFINRYFDAINKISLNNNFGNIVKNVLTSDPEASSTINLQNYEIGTIFSLIMEKPSVNQVISEKYEFFDLKNLSFSMLGEVKNSILKNVYNKILSFNPNGIVNSDKVIGQLLVNIAYTSKSLYPNVLSFSSSLCEESTNNNNLLNINSNEKIPIIRLNYINNNIVKNKDLIDARNYYNQSSRFKNVFFENEELSVDKYFDINYINNNKLKNLGFIVYGSSKVVIDKNDNFNKETIQQKITNKIFELNSNQNTDNEQNNRVALESEVFKNSELLTKHSYVSYLNNISSYEYISEIQESGSNFELNEKLVRLDTSSDTAFRKINNFINSPLFMYAYFPRSNANIENKILQTDLLTNDVLIKSFTRNIEGNIKIENEASISRRLEEGNIRRISVKINALDSDTTKNGILGNIKINFDSLDFEKFIFIDNALNNNLPLDKINYETYTSVYRNANSISEYIKKDTNKSNTSFNDSNLTISKRTYADEFDLSSIIPKDFFLLKNTNIFLKKEQIYEKFILNNENLTYPSEDFDTRIIAKSNGEGIKRSISYKDFYYDILNLDNSLKQIKSNYNKNVINTRLSKIFEKTLELSNKSYSLIHTEKGNESIFSFEDSPFIIKKDKAFSINNFLDTKEINVLKTTKLEQDDLNDIKKPFNINEYEKHLKKNYTDSYLKNSSDLFCEILKSIKSCLTSSKNLNKQFLSYTKLLSDSISTKNKIDTVKQVMTFSLIKHNDLNNFENWKREDIRKEFYHKSNSDADDVYKKYLADIFSQENYSNQKSYTLRIIDNSFMNKNVKDLFNENNNSTVGVIPGVIYKFLFPFIPYVKEVKETKTTSVEGNNSFSLYYKQLNDANQFLTFYTYNYDSYVVNYDYENSEEFIEFANFDVKDQKSGINYWVPNNKLTQNDDKNYFINSSMLAFNDTSADRLVIDKIDQDFELRKNINYVMTNSNYNSKFKSLYDYYPILCDRDSNNICNAIHKIIIKILNLGSNDEFSTVDEIYEFLNNNENIVKNIGNILNVVCKIYSSYFDNIVEESVLNYTSNKIIFNPLENIDSNQFYNEIASAMWNNTVVDLFLQEIETLLNNNENKAFTEYDLSYDKNSSLIYSDRFVSLDMIYKTLINSDGMEALTHDLIYTYLLSVEETKNKIPDLKLQEEELESKLKEDFDLDLDEENRIPEIFDNKIYAAKLSKKLQNNFYYKSSSKDKFFSEENLDIDIRSVEKKYSDINNFFDHILKEKEAKNILANNAINKIYLLEDQHSFQKFDIIRFGITHEIANLISNEKLLNIKVYPINHKFPEIEFSPFDFYYYPAFTNIIPAFVTANPQGFDINEDIGFYDLSGDNFNDFYKVIKNPEVYIFNLIKERGLQKDIFANRNNILEVPEMSDVNAATIVEQNRISNYIKDLEYIKDKVINSDNVNDIDLIDGNLISKATTSLYSNIGNKKFEKIFLENKSIVNEKTELRNENLYYDSKLDLVESKIRSIEFLHLLDYDISNISFNKFLTKSKYHDIFSIKISRKMLEKKIKGGLGSLREFYQDESLGPQDLLGFDNSYQYIIEIKVI